MEKYRIKACILSLILIFLSACSEEFKSINTNERLAFSYNGFEKTLSLNSKLDNFLLVFFTKECNVCNEQIPILKDLALKNDLKIFLILDGIKDENEARIWSKKKDLKLSTFYEKRAGEFFSSVVNGVYGVPVLSVFKNGKMSDKFIGLTPLSVLEKSLFEFS
ncbi:thioredoxin family protein [Campylobacter sp. LR286c]|uniref:thioredoxin family protein n=1 Tax=Campylobacter sp. LR286c TaxID=2593545 RepID=UPI001237DD41|nr:thioredoxin family protein [Campylobacter sp. LR286c]KAA6227290.1 thioredoxin family protein [Campylobacter sp. LR286c]